jgi:hypothetical protein
MDPVGKDSAQAKSAAFALATGWADFMSATSDKIDESKSFMRKTALDVICQTGYADDSVYDSLEKSYLNNFISKYPDFEEIHKTLIALSSINTDQSVNMLFIFLQGLNQKKNNGIWTNKEEQIFPWIVENLSVSNRITKNIWSLLVLIFRTEKYSESERNCAKEALVKIREANKQPEDN